MYPFWENIHGGLTEVDQFYIFYIVGFRFYNLGK